MSSIPRVDTVQGSGGGHGLEPLTPVSLTGPELLPWIKPGRGTQSEGECRLTLCTAEGLTHLHTAIMVVPSGGHRLSVLVLL